MSHKPAKASRASRLAMGDLSDALGFRIRLLDQEVMRSFGRHMSPLKISPTLYSILVLIEANPQCRQTEVSQALAIHLPNLADRVAQLIERGLVQRQEDPNDRRASGLTLTAYGTEFMRDLKSAHAAHIAELQRLLGSDRYRQLMALTDPADL